MNHSPSLVPRIPVATYRLQFNGGFTFRDVRSIVPYLDELGISDIYSSPLMKTREGSLHGYDIVDPTVLNPELGMAEDFDRLVGELRDRKMGQILDIVPNHLCITSKDNVWWMDVLENGPSSAYADFFDINWEPTKNELRERVLLPILGDQYGKVLDRGEISLTFHDGAFYITYFDHRLPVRPKTFSLVLQYRLDGLTERLSPDDPDLLELLSILTAINHLPDYRHKEEDRIVERWRETQIIKRRLAQLCKTSTGIRLFVERNVKLFNGTEGKPKSFDLLDNLLREQVYRLADWRVAGDEINYRRFFDINDLAAIRVENPEVFNRTHELIFKMIRQGAVTGLRVDHCDGLYNPVQFLAALQKACFIESRLGHVDRVKGMVPSHIVAQVEGTTGLSADETYFRGQIEQEYETFSLLPGSRAFYVIVEKILTRAESFPDGWPIFGTTGYDFLNSVNGIFVSKRKAASLGHTYSSFVQTNEKLSDIVYEKKKQVMYRSMFQEVSTLAHYLDLISEKSRNTRDFTRHNLTMAIVEVIAYFPVYRTYATEVGVADRDRRYIDLAVAKAKRDNPSIGRSVFDFLRDILVLKGLEGMTEEDKRERVDFSMRFQQVTGPVMAKAVEDTAFYLYNRLISLNEVGGDPGRLGITLDAFHGQNMERAKLFPHALIATSTHDSKRSEDVRARINVLSEIPDDWRRHVVFWSKANRRKKFRVDQRWVPDPNEEYFLYQTLVGAWPLHFDEEQYRHFTARVKQYMVKALREAKINSSWIDPDTAYEEACLVFIDSILSRGERNDFLEDFESFQKTVSHYGMLNSLAQTLLKIAAPGVPDFYQGTELWDFSLVDPDNRRPVDYGVRLKILEELKIAEAERGAGQLARELAENMRDGRIKLYLIYKALNYRRMNRHLFQGGRYIPLEVAGLRQDNVVTFMRRWHNQAICVVAPRFLTAVAEAYDLPLREAWKDTFVVIPSDTTDRYRNIFTQDVLTTTSLQGTEGLSLAQILSRFPVAFLEKLEE